MGAGTNRSLKPELDLSFELPQLTFPKEGQAHQLPDPPSVPAPLGDAGSPQDCVSSSWVQQQLGKHCFAESDLSGNAFARDDRCEMLQPLPGSHFGISGWESALGKAGASQELVQVSPQSQNQFCPTGAHRCTHPGLLGGT